jgi:hypothetical protein
MLPGPGNPGFRSKALHLMLQQSWTVEDKPAPSEATLHRHIGMLVKDGVIELVEENKRSGNLYKLAEFPELQPAAAVASEDPDVVPSQEK